MLLCEPTVSQRWSIRLLEICLISFSKNLNHAIYSVRENTITENRHEMMKYVSVQENLMINFTLNLNHKQSLRWEILKVHVFAIDNLSAPVKNVFPRP